MKAETIRSGFSPHSINDQEMECMPKMISMLLAEACAQLAELAEAWQTVARQNERQWEFNMNPAAQVRHQLAVQAAMRDYLQTAEGKAVHHVLQAQQEQEFDPKKIGIQQARVQFYMQQAFQKLTTGIDPESNLSFGAGDPGRKAQRS